MSQSKEVAEMLKQLDIIGHALTEHNTAVQAILAGTGSLELLDISVVVIKDALDELYGVANEIANPTIENVDQAETVIKNVLSGVSDARKEMMDAAVGNDAVRIDAGTARISTGMPDSPDDKRIALEIERRLADLWSVAYKDGSGERVARMRKLIEETIMGKESTAFTITGDVTVTFEGKATVPPLPKTDKFVPTMNDIEKWGNELIGFGSLGEEDKQGK